MFLQDFFENCTENRHKNMSHIRSKDTKPEKQIRSALWKAGFRYRICDKRYPGKPDLIFPRYYKRLLLARSRRLPLFCFSKIKPGILEKEVRTQQGT